MNPQNGRENEAHRYRLSHENHQGKLERLQHDPEDLNNAKERVRQELERLEQRGNGDELVAQAPLREALKRLAIVRADWLMLLLAQARGGFEQARAWNSDISETLVSHMIYTRDGAVQNREPMPGKNMRYVVRNPGAWRGQNLLNMYNQSILNGQAHNGALVVWDLLSKFFMTQAGDFLARHLKEAFNASEPGAFAVPIMQRLRHAISTAQHRLRNAQAQARGLGLEFHSLNPPTETVLDFEGGGTIEFALRRAGIDVHDLDNRLYPREIRHMVSKTIADNVRYNPGVFATIVVTNPGGRVDEHCLFLSEYIRNSLKTVFACGLERDWEDGGIVSYRSAPLAIPPALMNAGAHRNNRDWVVRAPLNEHSVLTETVNSILTLRGLDLGDPVDQYRQLVHQRAFNRIKNLEGLPIQTYAFAGDNLMFWVTTFDHTVPWVRDLLRLPEARTNERFVALTVVHYQSLYTNIEFLMARMTYEYYTNVLNGQPGRWKQFKRGLYHPDNLDPERPNHGRRWQPHAVQEIPARPNPSDYETRDTHQRLTFPMRRVNALNFEATWAGLQHRRSVKGKGDITVKDYYLNDMDNDRYIVYVYPLLEGPGTDGVWNDLQLFRVNAERIVSQRMREAGLEDFYTFRRRYQGNNYFFREYLHQYPIAKSIWRSVWLLRYPGLLHGEEGWVREDQGSDEIREEDEEEAQQERDQAPPPDGPRRRHGRPRDRNQHRPENQGPDEPEDGEDNTHYVVDEGDEEVLEPVRPDEIQPNEIEPRGGREPVNRPPGDEWEHNDQDSDAPGGGPSSSDEDEPPGVASTFRRAPRRPLKQKLPPAPRPRPAGLQVRLRAAVLRKQNERFLEGLVYSAMVAPASY
jgi:hypothetical protein